MPDGSGIWSIDEAREQHLFSPALADAVIELFSETPDLPVADLGCGLGDYARLLSEAGLRVQAVEGTPDIQEIATFENIRELDLTQPFSFENRTNILCLEVGEHIPPDYESGFLDSIVRNAHSRIVLSWAIPGQGGNGHVNERPNDYIIEQMLNRGAFFDVAATESLRKTMENDELWWFEKSLMVFKTTPAPMIGCVMIAKDEEKTISRAINSVIGHVDMICVNISGSTDNTRLMIESTVPPGIRCKVIEPDWLGAADALNKAADECEKMGAEWGLRMDADCVLRGNLPAISSYGPECDGIQLRYYNLDERQPNGEKYICWRTWIYRLSSSTYKGVRHEGLFCNGIVLQSWDGTFFHYDDSGARPRVPATYLSDAEAMLEALSTEHDETMIRRYTFYIANSYKDGGKPEMALVWYRIRSQMGGFREEEAISLLYCMRESQDRNDFREGLIRFNERPDIAFDALENAYNSDDEEWIREVLLHTKNANWAGEIMFNDPANVWKCEDWVALCMMKLGDAECLSRWENLLKREDIPPNDVLRIQDTYLKATYIHYPTGV